MDNYPGKCNADRRGGTIPAGSAFTKFKGMGEAASRPVDFVKKVGKGRTLSADLTAAESRIAFNLLLDGAFHPAQAGAFLQALRIKELTQEELDGLADVFRARLAVQPPLAGNRTLVLNLASDTQRKGGLASLLAAHLLRRFGVGVGIVRSAPVLQRNRASFDDTRELAKLLDPAGPLFPAPGAGQDGSMPPAPIVVECATLIPGLADLDDLRSHLGFRSCLHTVEKLVNPWPESPMLLGISHKHYALRLAGTLAAQGLRGKILLGNHGTVDLVLHKETELVSVDPANAAAAAPDSPIREEAVSPADLGLELSPDVYSLGKFPQWREWLTAMAGPDAAQAPEARDNGLRRAVQYHLAVLLWAAGAAENPKAGLASARIAIPTLFV
jgi:anthranilate phosphoribosyltransferase